MLRLPRKSWLPWRQNGQPTIAKVKSLDALVVKVDDKRVNDKASSLSFNPSQFDKMAKSNLREVLSEACAGIFRGSITKDLISPNSWYIESLYKALPGAEYR
jgi:hypothetical protein